MSDALLVIIDSDDEDDDSLPSQSQHNPNQTPRRPPLTPRKLKAEPGSERRQLSITRFFSSPTSKSSPAYQPTIRSFFDGRSVAPQVVLPNDDGEPLAPVPDPFFYRSPSPTAYANANISKAVLAPAPSPFFYRSPSPTAYPNADMSKAVLAMSSSSTTNGFARNAGIQSVFENGFPSPLDNKVNRASPATSSRPTTNGDDSKKSQRRSFYEQDAAFIGFGGRGVPEKDLDATPSMLAEAPRVNGTPSLKLGAGPADLMQTHSEKSIPTPTTKPGLIQSNTTGAPSASLNPFQHPIRQGTGTWRLFGEHHKMSDMATTQHREGPNRLWAAVPTVRRKIPNTQTPPSQSLKTTIGHPAKAPPKATPSSRPPSAPTPSAFALGFRAIPAKGPLTADSISNPTLPARNTAAASHATDRHTTTTTATYSPNTIPLAMVSPTPTATTTPPSASAVTIPSFLFKSSCEVCNRTFAVKTSTIRNPHGDGYLCSVCAAIAAPESTIRGMKPVNASVQRFADANPDAQTMEMEIDMPDIGFDDVQPATDSQSETTDQAIFSSDQALVANIQAFGMSGSNQSQCDRVTTLILAPAESGDILDPHGAPDPGSGMFQSEQELMEKKSDDQEISMSPLDDSLRWKKLYTPESMSLKGKFELKDVNDAFVTNEKEVQRHNARVRQADYRERKKEKQDVGFPSSPLTTSPPPAGSPDRATKRRKVVHPGVWACDVHNDPDCVEDECFAQIFEEWDPLDEVTGIRTEENRFDPGLVYRAGPPAGLPKLEIKTGERENLWCRRLGVAFAHRNVGVTIKPYLRKRIRQLLRHTGDYPAFKDLIGQVIHVDFSELEAEEVCRSIAYDDPDLRSYKIPVASRIAAYAITSESWEEDCCDSLGCLPGRNKTDVVWFIQDCILELDNTDGHPDIIGGHLVQVGGGYLRLVPPRKWHTIRTQVVPTSKLRLKHEIGNGLAGWASGGIREPLRLLKDRMRDTMPAWMYVNEGSSDLMSIAWSPDGQRFGLGCVAFNDAYNKTGNILHGSLNSMTVRVMDGHKMMHHPGGIGPDPYYPTVSSVQFSQDGHFMFSGSFGKAVNIWRGDDGELLDSVDVGSEVLHIAVSPAHNRVVAAGCKSGIVALVRINDQGKRSGLSILPPQKTQVEASNIAWCNAAKPNWLVAAYDNALPSSNKGDIIVFDAVAEKVVARPKPASGRQFDVFLDHNSGYFATASSRGRKGAKSQVHIWSLDGRVGGSVGRLHEFDCESEDINKVTISPCDTYVSASGTDGNITVWDRRNPNERVHVLSHGKTLMLSYDEDDTEGDGGVNFTSWGPTNDRLYTGSSDGVVKVWDIKRGDPFVRDFAKVNTQIMSGAFSHDHEMLMIGEFSGKATLYSTRGDRGVQPQSFKVDKSDITGPEVNVYEAARDLRTRLNMVNEEGYTWMR